MLDIDTLTPAALGLPAKFTSFRHVQLEALRDFVEYNESEPDLEDMLSVAGLIVAFLMPTGIGKTLFGVMLARYLGVKAVYLVATRALEDQVMRDFASIGMVCVHGRANYKCELYGDCDKGTKAGCWRANTDQCPYGDAVLKAKQSDLIVTNYAYWLYSRKSNGSALELDYGPEIGLVIADEAHALEGQLTSFGSVKLYEREIRQNTAPALRQIDGETSGIVDQSPWPQWARRVYDEVDEDDEDDYDSFSKRLYRVSRLGANHVWQRDERTGHITFSPIFLTNYIPNLISCVPRLLLMSASLTEFTMKMLMPKDSVWHYRSWPPVFNPGNSPVYHIPTVKLNWRSTDEDYKQVIDQADAIMDGRRDRTGILQTVSYARTKRVLEHSRHRDRFFWNESSADLGRVLELFRRSGNGVLVSPSVEEGFDFPEDQCEFQIVLKFPFPNEADRVVKERCTRIAGYRLHYAAQKLIQIRGRPVRSPSDRAEMFVLDNAVRQLIGKEGKSYLPRGFTIFIVTEAPAPPPPMGKKGK